jgi:hypothetical protein
VCQRRGLLRWAKKNAPNAAEKLPRNDEEKNTDISPTSSAAVQLLEVIRAKAGNMA